LGHSLGLTHCRNRRCMMYSSTNIEHTDFKASDFCPTCFELLKWHISKL
jgi:predicted Zn-dependent protease